MPLIKIQTSAVINEENQATVLADLSRIAAETIGKPEEYVMVSVHPAAMLMSGKPGAAAFVDVRSIGGLGDGVNRDLSQKICAQLEQSLGVLPNRCYINFTEFEAGKWGWNGETFG